MVNRDENACYIAHGDRVLRFYRLGTSFQVDIWDSEGRSNFHLGAVDGEVEALLEFLRPALPPPAPRQLRDAANGPWEE